MRDSYAPITTSKPILWILIRSCALLNPYHRYQIHPQPSQHTTIIDSLFLPFPPSLPLYSLRYKSHRYPMWPHPRGHRVLHHCPHLTLDQSILNHRNRHPFLQNHSEGEAKGDSSATSLPWAAWLQRPLCLQVASYPSLRQALPIPCP